MAGKQAQGRSVGRRQQHLQKQQLAAEGAEVAAVFVAGLWANARVPAAICVCTVLYPRIHSSSKYLCASVGNRSFGTLDETRKAERPTKCCGGGSGCKRDRRNVDGAAEDTQDVAMPASSDGP